MAFFDYPRYEVLQYKYKVPTYNEIKTFLAKDPTCFGISPCVIKPGVIVWGEKDVWVCMNIVDMPHVTEPKIDVHWVHYARTDDPETDGTITHIQQVFNKVRESIWKGSFISLTIDADNPEILICPYCNISLELVALADRCPKCHYIKNG